MRVFSECFCFANSLIAFTIPGTTALALVAAPLFGFPLGCAIVHASSTIGACISFFLAKKMGTSYVHAKFPQQFDWFKGKIEENKHKIFYYFLSVKVNPLAPNFCINMASGLVGVPFQVYLPGTILGQIPFTYLLVSTGQMLDEITTLGALDTKVSPSTQS